MRGFQKNVLDHICDDGMTYLPSSPSVYKTVVGPSSEFDSCGMDHALIEMKRGISDGGNPLLFMWLSLTPSIITVMREFRYYPSSAGRLPERPAPERYRFCSGLSMGSKLPRNISN